MTANDSDVSDGETLTGSQVVRVYGNNLTAPFVTLTFGEVEYTPLTQGEGYIEFILGDNGTATIRVDGSRFMSFEIEGIVVPQGLPTSIQMSLTDSATWYEGNKSEPLSKTTKCLQYPHKVNESFPYFYLYVQKRNEQSVLADFAVVGGTFTTKGVGGSGNFGFAIEPTNTESVAYVTFQGFIVAVFNYTTE